MLKPYPNWTETFRHAKHGHTLWDGNAPDPHNPAHAATTAWRFYNHAAHLGFFKDGGTILDLGCGNGRFGIPLSDKQVQYVGIDPVKECVVFAQWAFRDFSHLRFEFADIWNEVFNPKGAVKPENYKIPFPDGHFSDLICYSVFTHLQHLHVAQNYMSEIKRVLKPGGKLFVTWYRSPPDSGADKNVGRTVYNEWDIMTMMNGFSVEFSYGGHSGKFYDQWCLFCTKL